MEMGRWVLNYNMSRWWFQILFLPLLGEMIRFDEHLFQMGWNHHLDVHVSLHGQYQDCIKVFRARQCKWYDFPPPGWITDSGSAISVDFKDVASPVNRLGEINNLPRQQLVVAVVSIRCLFKDVCRSWRKTAMGFWLKARAPGRSRSWEPRRRFRRVPCLPCRRLPLRPLPGPL